MLTDHARRSRLRALPPRTTHAGAPALGVTAPSTNDVRFLRGLAGDLGLGAAWITNGVFTIEIPAASFALYQEPAR